MSQEVKNLIIGFGKAGKTLAGFLGAKGESTVLVEKSPVMYGGTCINVGCIPSKTLATAANRRQFSSLDSKTYYKEAVQGKKALIAKLNQANYNKVANNHVQIVDGQASFVDDHTVLVATKDGQESFKAERIFINTGATPFVPKVPGLELGQRIHTNESLMNLEELPEEFIIIGSGFIGLEFASMYAQFGSQVTVVDPFAEFLPREDRDVADAIKAQLESLGVTFKLGVSLQEVKADDKGVDITVSAVDNSEDLTTLHADHVLVATGRKANTADLALDKAGVETNERGAIRVNEYLQTNKDHIFALGDVNGGPQFTFVSLDDFRVVKNFLYGDKSYSTKKRMTIPTSTFIYPTYASVGLNEKAAQAQGLEVKVATLSLNAVPKAKVLGNPVGFYKVVVDAKTNQILGAMLFGEEAHEVINVVATAMAAGLPYTFLRDQLFTHPTMAEALNDVFGLIK